MNLLKSHLTPSSTLYYYKTEFSYLFVCRGGSDSNKFKEKLQELAGGDVIKGYSYDVVSKVFITMTGKKVTLPGSFKSSSGGSAVKCTVKANDGLLYPLERSFLFVHKPTFYIRFEDIAFVEFARVSSGNAGANTRTFDLLVGLSNGTSNHFTGIQRQEYEGLINFIIAKKIKIRTSGGNVRTLPSHLNLLII
jgi:structure-specific recognition protein 1